MEENINQLKIEFPNEELSNKFPQGKAKSGDINIGYYNGGSAKVIESYSGNMMVGDMMKGNLNTGDIIKI